MRLLSPAQKRIAIFAAVGLTCFGAQLVILTLLARLGTYRPVANAIAFAVSAQLNFLLSSHLTWGDRPASGRRDTGARWLAYNGTAGVSLGVNTAVFTLAYRAIGTSAAAAIGVVAGTCVVYLACNFLVFRVRRAARAPRRPGPGGPFMSAAAATAGVTVVMPAYREEANLAGTVEDMLTTLDGIGEEHVVVVVNDGSRDRTGEIADDLAARYPGRVHVVHHEVNRGYGAAVRTGIATALAHTRHAWLFLTDSDGQFRGEQLPHFLAAARAERADAVIGFRPRRADPAPRKVNAWLWTQASRLLLGVGTRDVDCAYKLISRQVLDGVPLRGNAALISPEIMMRIRAQGARIVQRPVNHYPRLHGEQTGANLSVILASLLGLLGLWRERVTARPAPRRRTRPSSTRHSGTVHANPEN